MPIVAFNAIVHPKTLSVNEKGSYDFNRACGP